MTGSSSITPASIPPAVAGLARVVKAGYPDPTQFDPKSEYHDPGSNPDDPRWFSVDIASTASCPAR